MLNEGEGARTPESSRLGGLPSARIPENKRGCGVGVGVRVRSPFGGRIGAPSFLPVSGRGARARSSGHGGRLQSRCEGRARHRSERAGIRVDCIGRNRTGVVSQIGTLICRKDEPACEIDRHADGDGPSDERRARDRGQRTISIGSRTRSLFESLRRT